MCGRHCTLAQDFVRAHAADELDRGIFESQRDPEPGQKIRLSDMEPSTVTCATNSLSAICSCREREDWLGLGFFERG